VCAEMIALSAIMVTIFWLAGTWSALLGAGLWLLSEPIARNLIVAQPDVWAIMFTALCVMLSVRAILNRNVWLSLLSTIMGLAATAYKYPCAPVLLMPAISYLWLLRKTWRECGPTMISYIAAPVLVAGVAYYLLVVQGGSNMNNSEAINFRVNAGTSLMNPYRWGLLGMVLMWMVGVPFVLVGAAALPTLAIRRVRVLSLKGLISLSLFVTGLLLFTLALMYIRNKAVSDQIFDAPPKYLLPSLVLLLIAACAAIGKALFTQTRLPMRLFVLFLPIFWMLSDGVQYITEYHRPSSFVEVQKWFEQNVPEKIHYWTGGFISYRILNRYEGGYWGFKEFYGIFGQTTDDRKQMPDDLTYVMVTDLEKTFEPFRKVWLPEDSMTLVKLFDNQNRLGPKIYLYSPTPLPSPQQTSFSNGPDEIVMRGVQINQTGNTITLKSYWQAPKGIPQLNYSFFVHVVPLGTTNRQVAQQDQQLGKRPTSTWSDPQEILEGGTLSLALPSLPPGDYAVIFGVYDSRSGVRLKLADGQTTIELTRFSIF